MSPDAYERLREKVKGPDDLEKELKRGEQMAELSFELQTDEKLREKLRSQAHEDLRTQGIENVFDVQKISLESRKALEQGKFLLAVASHPATHEDQLVAVPEGNVQERIPIKTLLSDQYISGSAKRTGEQKRLLLFSFCFFSGVFSFVKGVASRGMLAFVN